MRTIHLHGFLGEKYGTVHHLEADTIAQVLCGMHCNHPDFLQSIKQGNWVILDGTREVDLPEVPMSLAASELHFVPEVVGAGRGFGKFVAGIALVGLAIYTGGAGTIFAPWGFTGAAAGSTGMAFALSAMAKVGLGLALFGVAHMLAPNVETNPLGAERPEERPSLLFNGAVNVVEQGGAVPLAYGFETMVGSTVISSGIDVEQF